jgi:DNA polymerase
MDYRSARAQWEEILDRLQNPSPSDHTLHLDYETKADTDLTKVGLDTYSSPKSNPAILMGAYRINRGATKGPLQHWEAHKRRIPNDLKEALLDPRVQKWAFNAQFERVMTRRVLEIPTPRGSWRCSMVLAYMQSFNGGLGEVGEQCGLPIDKQKLTDGRRLIRKFTIPYNQKEMREAREAIPALFKDWDSDPEDWEFFCDYNKQDLIAEEALKSRLIRFPIQESEWEFYELDQLINDRGIPVDHKFITGVRWMAAHRKAEILNKMVSITGLDNPNSAKHQLLPWLQERGYPYDDLTKESVEKALKRDKSGEIGLFDLSKDVLEFRQWASRTSTSKADTALLVTGDDARARFLFQFVGAGRTGRFSGRLIQPQNMTRTPKILDPEHSDERLTMATNLIRNGDYKGFRLFLDEPMIAFTGAMRGLFRAPDGYEFTTCDLSQIEFIGLGYLARCQAVIDVYLSGRDPYKDFGVSFYKKPYEEITSAERQICKPPVLACGYRLGPGKEYDGVKTGLIAYAENMGVDMTVEEAEHGVKVYRKDKFPEVEQFWYDIEKAIKYVLTTHQPFILGCLRFEWLKPYLLIRLPSGRYLYYYKPILIDRVRRTGKMIRKRVRSQGMFIHGVPEGQWVIEEDEETYVKKTFTFMGRNHHKSSNPWERIDSHGGIVAQNVTEGICRDVLMVGMRRLHALGLNIVGHAHDEIIALTREGDNYYNLDLMREEMTREVSWAPGFPLRAAGWHAPFYRKA